MRDYDTKSVTKIDIIFYASKDLEEKFTDIKEKGHISVPLTLQQTFYLCEIWLKESCDVMGKHSKLSKKIRSIKSKLETMLLRLDKEEKCK